MHGYEGFDPNGLRDGTGELYLEVTPLTFAVTAREGIALSQLRLFYGEPSHVEITGQYLWRTVFRNQAADGTLSLNLTPSRVGRLDVIAFSSRTDVSAPIPLWETEDKPDPCGYWRLLVEEPDGRLLIEPGEFYLLRSKERMWVPPGIAIYCRASDETIGEMRIHYAGFVHPLFGSGREDGAEGTPLIFEVRGHDFRVSLKDGERMARLTFYRMSQDAVSSGTPAYTNQDLQLSKATASDNGCVDVSLRMTAPCRPTS